jgi:hypothetical protein
MILCPQLWVKGVLPTSLAVVLVLTRSPLPGSYMRNGSQTPFDFMEVNDIMMSTHWPIRSVELSSHFRYEWTLESLYNNQAINFWSGM